MFCFFHYPWLGNIHVCSTRVNTNHQPFINLWHCIRITDCCTMRTRILASQVVVTIFKSCIQQLFGTHSSKQTFTRFSLPSSQSKTPTASCPWRQNRNMVELLGMDGKQKWCVPLLVMNRKQVCASFCAPSTSGRDEAWPCKSVLNLTQPLHPWIMAWLCLTNTPSSYSVQDIALIFFSTGLN